MGQPGGDALGPGSSAGPFEYSTDEMMTLAAARELRDGQVCFVGIGLPSVAANVARALHAPRLVLVYESGAIGSKPTRLPLSIGDGELADTADAVVSMPEVFNYWLQGGRINVGMLSAAQIDRYANLNSTAIGEYVKPRVRLPGAGGAPEIAASCGHVLIVLRQSKRSFVEKLDFLTTVGFGAGPGDRERFGFAGGGPRLVVTDLGILRPDPRSCELTLTETHPGSTVDEVLAATGWPLAVAPDVRTTQPPTAVELTTLRALLAASR